MNYSGAYNIASTTIRNIQHKYWVKDGTARKMALAALEHDNIKGQADAMKYVLEKNSFICNFDDPCDEVDPYAFAVKTADTSENPEGERTGYWLDRLLGRAQYFLGSVSR